MRPKKLTPFKAAETLLAPISADGSSMPETKITQITLCYEPRVNPADRRLVLHSRDCYQCILETWEMTRINLQEEFKIILLNRRNRILGIVPICYGGLSATIADPKIVFAAALIAGASTIVLVHNHPSGELSPSANDVSITKRLKAAGELLDIPIVDHLIISAYGYYSFTDEGML